MPTDPTPPQLVDDALLRRAVSPAKPVSAAVVNLNGTTNMPISTPIDQKLQDARKVRDELAAALKEKISALKRDRDELVAEYEEEIGSLDVELRALGVGTSGSDHPSDLAVKAYNYLLSHPGERFHGGQLMTAIHAQGAVPSIVLASLLYAGKIKREGERRSTRYFVQPDA